MKVKTILQAAVVCACVGVSSPAENRPATSEVRYVKNRQGDKPTPIVAKDNACAWPNLTVLPDGAVAAVIFNAPYHGNIVGDVECWASTDGGRTWQKRGTPAAHDPPNTNRMNVAAGLAKNGDFIVISSGWLLKMPATPTRADGSKRYPGLVEVLTPWLCRSSDGGRTWLVDRDSLPKKSALDNPLVPYGDIVEGNDGTLRVAMYSFKHWRDKEKRYWRSYVYRSRDDGMTWGEPVCVSDEKSHNETAILHLGQGKWLAGARGGGLHLYVSVDDGQTWTHRMKLRVGGYPGHFLRLRSGRVLLVYGTRSGTERSTNVIYSDDQGATWSKPVRLVDYQGKDGGYPSSVQLPDGQVLTAYYAKRADYHPRYHMGALTWDPTLSLR